MRGKLILISGPSGVGKGSVRQKMQFRDYTFSVSSTTRTKRAGELDGVHYNFLNNDEFKEKIEKKDMLEYAEFVGNLYGTDKEVVEKSLNNGQNVLLEIECQGALQVLEQLDDVISIFLVPPSIEELENRLNTRGTETQDKIQKRLTKAKEELEYAKHYKYTVVNDNIDDASKEIDNILKKYVGEK